MEYNAIQGEGGRGGEKGKGGREGGRGGGEEGEREGRGVDHLPITLGRRGGMTSFSRSFSCCTALSRSFNWAITSSWKWW